jgi:hypothetical protein
MHTGFYLGPEVFVPLFVVGGRVALVPIRLAKRQRLSELIALHADEKNAVEQCGGSDNAVHLLSDVAFVCYYVAAAARRVSGSGRPQAPAAKIYMGA